MTLRGVLFDVGNTLLGLDYPRLADRVGGALGRHWSAAELAICGAGAAREVETQGTENDRAVAFLTALFQRAGVTADEMPRVHELLRALHAERHLWTAVAPGTRPALERLRSCGLRLGVVSNGDGRVAGALAAAGLADCFDAVVDSALAGAEKPDPRIFQVALSALELAPAEAVYLGDLLEVDVAGARAAGLAAVLLAPDGIAPAGVAVVQSVSELAERLLSDDQDNPMETWIST